MDALEELLGGPQRVRVLKLFIQNPESYFDSAHIVRRSRVPERAVRRELSFLLRIHFVKSKRAGGSRVWFLNPVFPILTSLTHLLTSARSLDSGYLARQFRSIRGIKLIIAAGIFIKNDRSRLDLLVVGDRVQKRRVETLIRHIEAEMGRELTYYICATDDFTYRLGAYDKFIRDILDYPHEKVIDKLGVA